MDGASGRWSAAEHKPPEVRWRGSDFSLPLSLVVEPVDYTRTPPEWSPDDHNSFAGGEDSGVKFSVTKNVSLPKEALTENLPPKVLQIFHSHHQNFWDCQARQHETYSWKIRWQLHGKMIRKMLKYQDWVDMSALAFRTVTQEGCLENSLPEIEFLSVRWMKSSRMFVAYVPAGCWCAEKQMFQDKLSGPPPCNPHFGPPEN